MDKQPDLEALLQRRDDLEALLLRGLGTPADWDEQRRLSARIQDALCARLDAYLDARRQPPSDSIVIDHEACDAWIESHSAADIYPHTEE